MATQGSGAFTDLGKREDLYYTDPDNCKVESIPVEYNTRFTQDFSNKLSGSSTFIIPPGNGLKHVVICLQYAAGNVSVGTLATSASGDYVLPVGWGYNAVRQISFRVGGSSQYFMSGAQLLAANLRMVRTQTQAQALLNFGGSEYGTVQSPASSPSPQLSAYIVVPVWCPPSADGLSVPLPADTLAQQVQITCELQSPWAANQGGTAPTPLGAAPGAFDVAFFQVEQLCMTDRGMAISNHVDLNSHELLMPITFNQQELQVPIAAGTPGQPPASQSVTLTGFRSGQVKAIQAWLTVNRSDTAANASTDAANPLVWLLPKAITVLYAGTIYAQYNSGTSAIFNLLDGTKPVSVSTNQITMGVPVPTSSSTTSSYVMLPFGNPTGDDYSAEVLTHGKPILNGLVNLQITPPTVDPYTLHVQYIYNSTLVFSKSSAEFRF
jgi:hypothetical protein